MLSYGLNEDWQMKIDGQEKVYKTNIPTSMYQILWDEGEIESPYVGENDKALTALSDYDCAFSKSFQVGEDLLAYGQIEMVFEGIDTIAEVWINDRRVLKTDNMHRTYRVDVKTYLQRGENLLNINISSPTKFIKEKQGKDPLWGIADPIAGYEHLRKAHHMFGWDWGPQLPDMGIWRPIYIEAFEEVRLDNVYVTQNHGENDVVLELAVEANGYETACNLDGYELKASLSYESEIVAMQEVSATRIGDPVFLKVEEPKIWWPNGYGEQPLYTLTISLLKDGQVCDELQKRIGLRTVTMTREADQWGESFDMTINGVRIFAMGADYIPEDILISKMNKERTAKLLLDCKRANFNHIRVWGGAFYPGDDFYDLCDELGLLVWQDFMFACGVYRLSSKFEANITAEFIDNIKRIRHHACLALWCGNNEMEMALLDWGLPKDERLKLDYLRMYEQLIPDTLEIYDPNTFYWPASPSSGGGFDDPNGDSKGDVHFWEVFHGNKHYKAFREHYFRFASEYGMQSLPDMKTIESFSTVEEREFYGPVMENHNKCQGDINGNMKIMLNMSAEFGLPNNLEDIVYLSQVFQGETIRCAVEHMRRNRGRCMGSTYWQLNDNWPVASWSSIDYYGRWKGMHYMVKRFYAPVHATAYEQGNNAFIHICNEKRDAFKGQLHWEIRHMDQGILSKEQQDVTIDGLSSNEIVKLSVEPWLIEQNDLRKIYVSYHLVEDTGAMITSDILLFVAHKHFQFVEPGITCKLTNDGDQKFLEVSSKAMAKSVSLSWNRGDWLLSDNFFDLCPEETKLIEIIELDDIELVVDEIKIQSVNTLSYI